MPNTELTFENVREEVVTSLGGSGVVVELTPNDVQAVLKKALRVLSRYQPRRGRLRLNVSRAQKRYRVDDLIPNLNGVVGIEFITRRVDPSDVDPFDPYVVSLASPSFGDETFADMHQRLTYAEDASRIVSGEPEWHGQWEIVDNGGTDENQYALYISIVRTEVQAACEYTAKWVPEETPYGLLGIPASEVDWVMEYVVAYSKTILSRIRGKFGGITNSDGSPDVTDSAELAQEGREDLQRLEEEMQKRRRPFLPVIE